MKLKKPISKTACLRKSLRILEKSNLSTISKQVWCSRPEIFVLPEQTSETSIFNNRIEHLHFCKSDIAHRSQRQIKTQRDTSGQSVSSESLRKTSPDRNLKLTVPNLQNAGTDLFGLVCQKLKSKQLSSKAKGQKSLSDLRHYPVLTNVLNGGISMSRNQVNSNQRGVWAHKASHHGSH